MALVLMAVCLGGIITILLQPSQEEKDLEMMDGMIYQYIVAKVEGNDDVLADLLAPDAQAILEPGRHAFPGDAERMGERYKIIRYDDHYAEGGVLYETWFYRPSTDRINKYNIVVENTDEGWVISDISSIDEEIMQQVIGAEEGTVVHDMEGDAAQ